MKKVLAIFLALIIGLSMSAQIQNKFLGFTLGTTTKSEVYNKYKNEKDLIVEGDDIYVGDLKFAGQVWDITTFRFYNNRLMAIQFSITDRNTPESLMESTWEIFKGKLWNKYSDYYFTSSTSDFILYSDGNIDLTLSRSVVGKGVNLLYCDCVLREQQKISEDSEL